MNSFGSAGNSPGAPAESTTVRVVINQCFGGFGLSAQAEVAYLARKGKQAFFYTEDRSSGDRSGQSDLVRVDAADVGRSLFSYTSTRDFGERVSSDDFWGKGEGNDNKDWYFYDDNLDRDDPDLVAVVEELGAAADGGYAKLAVVEVPDGVSWHIHEYDGTEHVAEDHRTWR